MKAGKLAIRPWLSCPYNEHRLLDLPSSVALPGLILNRGGKTFPPLHCTAGVKPTLCTLHVTLLLLVGWSGISPGIPIRKQSLIILEGDLDPHLFSLISLIDTIWIVTIVIYLAKCCNQKIICWAKK